MDHKEKLRRMSKMETLTVDRADGVVIVTMNRPRVKNALNGPMWEELLTTFTAIAQNAQDRVVILTGAGGAFCSGKDLAETPDAWKPELSDLGKMRYVSNVVLALHRMPKPTIAKVTGAAVGAGCNLALGCDLIVASDVAKFSEIFGLRGLTLDSGGSWLLPRMIGLHRAKEIAFFSEVLSAEEARDFGLVNRVVPSSELDAFVAQWAARLAAAPPLGLSMTKVLLNNSLMTSMDQALEHEAQGQAFALGTDDFAEAIAAFLEKRDPRFGGT
jgi:2-(1,2-epoxy-1,2-dihydrophenyl)acetyl-CoA isomerase